MTLDHIDKAILRFLIQYNGWTTANYISASLGISWITVARHLEVLEYEGYVIKGTKDKLFYWRVNR